MQKGLSTIAKGLYVLAWALNIPLLPIALSKGIRTWTDYYKKGHEGGGKQSCAADLPTGVQDLKTILRGI